MITILKASAGSGKTFKLTETYIRTLFESASDHPYRHILAVTFTNKATAEMKGRILKELCILAADPSKSAYHKSFVPSLFKDLDSLKTASEHTLTDILHDYGAFSVSTIDKFFQQTLKAFSREIGQFSSYQIELDRKSLVHESVDRMLDSLTEGNSELMTWLKRSVNEQLSRGDKVNLENNLYDMADKLSSEERKRLTESMSLDEDKIFSKEELKELDSECSALEKDFVSKVKTAAERIVRAFNSAAVDLEETNRKFLAKVLSYASLQSGDEVSKPTDAFLKKASDSGQWFAKSKADSFLQRLDAEAFEAVKAFCSLWGDDFRLYSTALLIKSQVFGLGLASEFRREFDALLKEKNVLGIEDSNSILRNIIDGSDAPFVYEKLGVRYEHFLLDEFQDTSTIQWQNFQPLLNESDANSRGNLVVGDVKQSIYRWRGSDWELLDSGVARQFPSSLTKSLQDNWRSTRAVVSFNNCFFAYAAKVLDSLAGIDGYQGISDIYADVVQTIRTDDTQEGSVEVTFCDKEKELEMVCESVRKAQEAGARWADIAILVRNNKEGGEVASSLIAAGIPVLSDDSLDVKASSVVRRLVALLSCVDNPDDSLNTFLISELHLSFPRHWHSLADLCEALLRELRRMDEQVFVGEVLYIQSFMDSLLDWTSKYGNNLMLFLKYWNEGDFSVSSPSGTDAVRVMTIHKSKGLEFPYVIVPFAEKVTLSGKSWHWCAPSGLDASLKPASGVLFPVSMNKSVQDTAFSEDYKKERLMQLVDAINTFYVALTRAGKALHVIACNPPAKCQDACRSGQLSDFKDFSQILCCYLNGDGKTFGKPYDFGRMARKAAEDARVMDSNYPSIAVNPGCEGKGPDGAEADVRERGRLKFSADSVDFFGEDGRVGSEASRRINGIVLHSVLSEVDGPDGLKAAMDAMAADGQLTPEEAAHDTELLALRLRTAKERGWFPEDARVLREHGIVSTDGRVYRPDRVVCTPQHTYVIDYKFGTPAEIYKKQVAGYVSLLRQMGYPEVSGYIWYVPEDRVVDVCSADEMKLFGI